MSGKYRTIVADPPWDQPTPGDFGGRGNDTRVRREVGTWTNSRSKALPYPTMTVEAIAALDVPSDDDAHLLLWTTNRYVEDAYRVARAWGFGTSQLLTWCKPPMGLGPGGVFVSTSEFVVYARRGKPEHEQRVDSTWFQWPRGAHSTKPAAFLDLVEQTFPGPYLEMFARRARFGWDYWGDQSLNTAEVAA